MVKIRTLLQNQIYRDLSLKTKKLRPFPLSQCFSFQDCGHVKLPTLKNNTDVKISAQAGPYAVVRPFSPGPSLGLNIRERKQTRRRRKRERHLKM